MLSYFTHIMTQDVWKSYIDLSVLRLIIYAFEMWIQIRIFGLDGISNLDTLIQINSYGKSCLVPNSDLKYYTNDNSKIKNAMYFSSLRLPKICYKRNKKN